MSNHDNVKPLLIGTLGAVIGATAMIGLTVASTGLSRTNVAFASGEDDQERIISAVKHVAPSVVALDVSINGTRVVPTDPFAQMFGSPYSGGSRLMPYHEQASGSGFVYSPGGLIVTNDHVVHGASTINVVFDNGDRIPGHIYSENRQADLALVQLDRHYAKLPPPVAFGSSHAVQQGEWAIAIGEPFALKQTVTVGVVSGFNRDETIGGENDGPREFKGLLQTSAPINPGNSGGPLIDLDGRLIGVNQSVAQPAQDIGFAIPIDTVRTDVATLAAHPGVVTTTSVGFLGVELQALDPTIRTELHYTGAGAAIVGVMGGSPADQAGLQPGDIIQSIDGKAVDAPSQVTAIAHDLAPGAIASLRVWQNGTRELIAVHVGDKPDQAG
jgi:serine protease Do